MQQLKFIQRTGKLYADGKLIGLCFSGNGPGLNNPAYESIHDVGVIPANAYVGVKIVLPEKGPDVWCLTPVNHDKYDRSAFMLHWNNRKRDFTASDGCIVPVDPATFLLIDHAFYLTVVADEELPSPGHPV